MSDLIRDWEAQERPSFIFQVTENRVVGHWLFILSAERTGARYYRVNAYIEVPGLTKGSVWLPLQSEIKQQIVELPSEVPVGAYIPAGSQELLLIGKSGEALLSVKLAEAFKRARRLDEEFNRRVSRQ
jgi:hypothetical protein